jgi:large subunit ribosomal protein L40e
MSEPWDEEKAEERATEEKTLAVDEEHLLCPITGEAMVDPVIDPEGYTYEKEAILSWVNRNGTSPMTRNPLSANQLTPNRALRDALRRRRLGFYDDASDDESPECIQLYVKNLSNKTRLISIDPTAFVCELKSKIEEMDGIPIDEQRLIWGGKQLQDENCLSDYNLVHHSTVHLVLRLVGGEELQPYQDDHSYCPIDSA